jgi:hypothetical protein
MRNTRFAAFLAVFAIGGSVTFACLAPPDLAAQAKPSSANGGLQLPSAENWHGTHETFLVARVRTGVGEGEPGDEVHGSRTAELNTDELQVTLQPGTGERFLKVVDVVMGTETARSLGRDKFVVRQGPRGERDDFAAFFAAMPYVKDVSPRPKRRPSENVPKGHILVPTQGEAGDPSFVADDSGVPGPGAGRDYVPGELLVKFKKGVSQKQIEEFNAENGTSILGRLDLGAERIYRLSVPDGVEVPDLAGVYGESDLVEYAEPNYKMSIPKLPSTPAKPAKPGKLPKTGYPKVPPSQAGMAISTQQVLGDSVFVKFQPGVREPLPGLVALVYGVEMMEEDNGQVRYSLPKGANSLTAARLFKLCPFVSGAEPSYGR